ncbi:multifunctional CCA addition/repair protein [Lysobacteraceae bacterium NML07-0707]|nr:multifunctional CCA addition/repair protein [Xanthomonadaceae bacterium NML07-0707]
MQVFLVGGTVRDELLGQPPGDRDYVVVGATPAQMRARGFTQVGRDFPVFLHPRTHEEYALARTERKSGSGHLGFVVHANQDVTLAQDLERRDFTINAIARDLETGELIDPFNGVADINARVLRHVGPAFAEDPLRVLRAARFLARLAPLGFTLAAETRALMQQMSASGELASLPAERIWQEMVKALRSSKPSAFLRCLHECGALAVLMPEIDTLYGVPQRAEYHPEIDAGLHTEMVCDMAARLAPGDDLIGFAALTHDLGKALTPPEELPHHIQHEQRGIAPLEQLAARLKVPNEHLTVAKLTCRQHLNVHRIAELKPATVLKLIESADGFRKPERIRQLAMVCEADARGRKNHTENPYPQAGRLIRAFHAARAVKAADVAAHLHGPAVGEALRRARIRAIAEALRLETTAE